MPFNGTSHSVFFPLHSFFFFVQLFIMHHNCCIESIRIYLSTHNGLHRTTATAINQYLSQVPLTTPFYTFLLFFLLSSIPFLIFPFRILSFSIFFIIIRLFSCLRFLFLWIFKFIVIHRMTIAVIVVIINNQKHSIPFIL